MGKKASAPPAPDYAGAAKAQGAANVEAARASAMLSNPNVYGPLGTQTVTYDGDIPTVRQTLTPQAQATLDAQQQVERRLAQLGLQGIGTAESTLGTPFQTQTGRRPEHRLRPVGPPARAGQRRDDRAGSDHGAAGAADPAQPGAA
jgi:hypothetical protein